MALLLLIEDDAVLRALFSRTLGRIDGVEVIVAGTVASVRDVLAAYTPDFVVADINLPDGTVFEAFGDDIPFPTIFVTGYARQYELLLPDLPDVTMLEKPVSVVRLRELVEERLGRSSSSSGCFATGPFSPSDYIHFCFASMRSLMIRFFNDEEECGSVSIIEGVAWSATDTIGKGMPALRRLMYETELRFKLDNPPAERPQRNINLPSHAVVRDLALFKRRVQNLTQVDRTFTGMVMEEKRHPTTGAAAVADSSRPAPLDTPPHRGNEELTPEQSPTVPEPTLSEEERLFQRLKDDALEALLMRDYPTALAAYESADRLIPGDASVASAIENILSIQARLGRG